MELIRPLYMVHEEDIISWKTANELSFIQCACRFTENCTMCDNGQGGSKRQEVKHLLKQLKKGNPSHLLEHTLPAAWYDGRVEVSGAGAFLSRFF